MKITYLELLSASQLREVARRIASDVVAASPYFKAFDDRMLAGMRECHAKKVWLGM